jgi:hypothetical protein
MEAAHGKQRHTHISREVFNEASCKRVIDEFHGEEDLSNQIRQAFGDAAITAVVGEGEDGFDEAGAWVVQEVREGDRRGVGEEVRLPQRAGAGDADAQLLREQRRKEPFGRAQAYARKREGDSAREGRQELSEEQDPLEEHEHFRLKA